MRQMIVVISTTEPWLSLKSLLQNRTEDNHLQLTFSSLGSHQVCDMNVDGRSVSLRYADLKQDTTEEGIYHAIDGCYTSCTGGICTFLLLIRGGHYPKRERRMIEMLQAHFGMEALKFLIVLSLEDGRAAGTLDDALLELINACEGRYCQITSFAASDELRTLLKMVNYTLTKCGVSGYTAAMLTEAKKRSAESMKTLRQKAQEVEEKGPAIERMIEQREEKRAAETSREEELRSRRALVPFQMFTNDDDDTKKTSLILLGLSGSGKSSVINLILERAGNQYSANGSGHEQPQPTLFCERKEVFLEGQHLILVDTPELWDEDGVENLGVVKDCLSLSLPGPHVFLLVLQVGRFTQGESEMLGQLQRTFGRDMVERAIILFVRFDCSQQRPQSINDHVRGAHATLQSLVQRCGSRYYELSVSKSQEALRSPHVKDLLSGIYKLAASYGGRPHSVKRFSVNELQERKKVIEGRKEVNFLLRDA